MIKLNKIYTRTGDSGTTGLVRGPRRPKFDLRVEAYGTVEEANAFIGQARLSCLGMPRIDRLLERIQNDLFDLGSDLATPGPDEGEEYPSLRMTPPQTDWLEEQIDHLNADLEPLNSFVLPGGTELATRIHLARVVVRRAERLAAELASVEQDINAAALTYLNRLSDLMFVLGRVANANGESDVLWQPGRFGNAKKS
ncbi:cob(I)yrinic acid a,c-diamide adenosyltransferase [Devosia pacifica]|uniref:Corrinoid adenosyltransferase n=1 Tax=Devosia pacifica TaxID=1335967 RepID=A0A918VVA0_9HYPH|nr:cob(I)yrinic acid a,c-diamide adenosyltransferase [Devosia pacifica]GHA26099.1 cob(I)yrinic acid a,c-diamide adenosyltransferase [Devosia pacifica]